MLFVRRWLLFAVRCAPCVASYLLFRDVGCCWLLVARWLSCVACCLLFAVCMLCVMYCSLCGAGCCLVCVAR